MNKSTLTAPLALLVFFFLSSGASGEGATMKTTGYNTADSIASHNQSGYKVHFSGYVKIWWILYEEVNNGLRHPFTDEEAPDEASGFSIYRARFRAALESNRVNGLVSTRFDGSSPGLLDAYFFAPIFNRHMELWAGQMKIPSTYEALTSGAKWDFLTRSRFSENVADYSLSRGPTSSYSRFYGARTYFRDLGVALKGKVTVRELHGDYFLMVGNGLGANRFVGGREKKQEIFANRFGDYLYAARVTLGTNRQSASEETRPAPVRFRVGGHVSWNHHRNIVLDDEHSVLNIKRRSWSVDLHAWIGSFVRLTGMYGKVIVDDDFDDDGKKDYQFDGWELKAMASLKPDVLEVGFRYDTFTDEFYENGTQDQVHAYTLGINYAIPPNIKLQINYKFKDYESDVNPVIDENVLILAAQLDI